MWTCPLGGPIMQSYPLKPHSLMASLPVFPVLFSMLGPKFPFQFHEFLVTYDFQHGYLINGEMVSLSLFVWYHLALISPLFRGFSCITLSYLRTQIKYANSRIWRSCIGPWCIILCCHYQLFLLGHLGE